MAAERVIKVKLVVDAPSSNVQAADRTAAGMDRVARSADGAQKSADTSASALEKWGKLASVAVAAGAALAAKAVLDLGLSYEKSLNTLQAVTGATADEMAQVSAAAKQLGNDIAIPGASASDAAEAITELAKGGLTLQQSLDAARGTLALATAAQISGAEAATIQADALNAFNLSAGDAGHVADVLANAANAATGEITDFSAGLAQSAAVAHSMGVSLDDTVTMLTLFANAGLKGSDAGTSLKTMLTQLQNPTDKAKTAMQELGLTVYDANGDFVGFRSVTDDLATAQANMSQEAFNAAAGVVFGSDAIRGATIAAEGGAVAFDDAGEKVAKFGGATEIAAAQAQGLPGAVANIQNGLENVALSIYEKVAPALESILNTAADALPAIGAFFEGVIDVAGGFFDIISSIPGPVLVAAAALGSLALLKGPVGSVFTSVTTAAKGFGEQMALQTGLARLQGVELSKTGAIMATTATRAKSAGKSLIGAFGGPVGLAVAGLVTILSQLGDKMSDLELETNDFSGAVDDLTAAISRQKIIDLIPDEQVKGLAEAGVALNDYAAAVAGDAEARTRVFQQLAQYTAGADGFDQIARGTDLMNQFRDDTSGAADAVAAQQERIKANAAEFGNLETATRKADEAMVPVSESAMAAAQGFGDLDTATRKANEAMELSGGAAPVAASAIGDIGGALAGVVSQAKLVPSPLDLMRGSLDAIDQAASDAQTELNFLIIELDKIAGRAPDTERAQRAAADSIRNYASELASQPALLKAVSDAQAEVDKLHADGVTDVDKLAEANKNLVDAQNAAGDSADAQFEAGEKLRGSIIEQALAAAKTASETGTLNDAQAAAQATVQKYRDDFVTANTALYGTADAAGAAFDQLVGIPSEVSTQIIATGFDAATLAAEAVKKAIEAIPTSRTIAVSYRGPVTGGVVGLEADGDVFRSGKALAMAAGGIRQAQMTKVPILWGEAGDESYIPHAKSKLRRSEQIMAKTAAILGGTYLPARPLGMSNGAVFGTSSSMVTNTAGSHTVILNHYGPGELAPAAVKRALLELERTGG